MTTLSSTTRANRSRARIYSHNPMLDVEFYTQAEGQISVGQQTRRYMSNRGLDMPGATARITLQGRHFLGQSKTYLNTTDIRDVLKTNDLCKVWMRDAEGVRHLDIIGTVRSIHVSEIEISGSPEHRVEIEVAGLGQSLVDYQVFWHPHIAGQNNFGGIGYLLRSKGQIPKGRPDQVIKALYDTFLNDKYIYRFSDGRTLRDSLRFKADSSSDALALMAFSAMGVDGPLWQTMKRYADQPWHELFVDIQHEIDRVDDDLDELGARDSEAIYFRPTPWGFQRWNKLSQEHGWGFSVEDDERIDDGFELSRNDSSVYNFFWVPGKSVFSAFDQLSVLYNRSGGLLPIYDADSIKRFGLRRLEQATEYCTFATKADQETDRLTPAQKLQASTSKNSLWQMLALRALQLFQWNGYEDFHEGQFTTRGRIGPHHRHGARVGSVLTRESDGWQFYVTRIMQIYNHPDQHSTKWIVAKGRNPQDYQRWWSDKLTTYTNSLSTKIDRATLRAAGLLDVGDNL